jgi:hypothetical protein
VILVGLALIGVGLAITIAEYRRFQRAHATARWPHVSGRIVSTSVHRGSARPDDQAADIRYEYEVNGCPYESRQLDLTGAFGGSGSRVAEALLRYEPGQKVRVHYDPQDPSQAVLQTYIDGSLYLRMGLGIALAFLGFIIL